MHQIIGNLVGERQVILAHHCLDTICKIAKHHDDICNDRKRNKIPSGNVIRNIIQPKTGFRKKQLHASIYQYGVNDPPGRGGYDNPEDGKFTL